MSTDPVLDGSIAVADPANSAISDDPILTASSPTTSPAATSSSSDSFSDDPIIAASTATTPASNISDPNDPIIAASSFVDPEKQEFIAQQRQNEQTPVLDKAASTAKGIGEGLGNFVTGTIPGVFKGAYDLATTPDLTPGEKVLAAGNTVLSNLATLPYLAKNAAQGAENIYNRNFGSGITNDEYGRQWEDLQNQNLTRRAFLNNGLQTMFGLNKGDPSTYSKLPASAEEFQNQLSPLLDVTNAIPFAGGLAGKLGKSILQDAGTNAAKMILPSMGRRAASALLTRGAGVTDVAANILDTVRHAPQKGLEALGVDPAVAEKMAGAPIHLLAGAAGGAEAILPILAGEAAPSLLRQFSAVQRAASQAVLTGESTASFVQRMAQGTQGFTRTLLNALDQTGLARVMGTVGDVAANGIKGGVLNPLTPLQFLASTDPEQFGQQVGQNIGFGVAGAATGHLMGESANQVAMRNYNDVVQFAAKLGKQSGSDAQLSAFNQMPFRAQVAVAQFANTRPDVNVILKPGGENSSYLDPANGQRTVRLNTSNPAAAVAHIAAHEYVHTLMMVEDNRSVVLSKLMGNPETGTEGPLGRWASGIFVPAPLFRNFIDGYTQGLAKDGATVNAKTDTDFYRTMAEEFYAETMASKFAGTNAKGETGLSRVYRTGDTISKMVDAVTGKSGAGILNYLDRKYAQGRIAPRFGADVLEKSIKAGSQGDILRGLQVLGIKALRENETVSGKPQEYAGAGHVEPTFSLNELRKNPQAAGQLFGASHDLVFAPDGSVVGQRTRAQANKAAKEQGKIWFDTLSKQNASTLPEGALRAVTRADAKGNPVTELEGKFLTDGQIDALVKANGLNRYQEGALRQVNRALQAQDGNVYHVVYQTASNGKGKYATLASSTRDMVIRQIRVTKDHNIILDAFDADQFLRNYDQKLQAAAARGGKMPVANPEQALRDYLANQAFGYTGAGQPLDPANVPAQPPARVFSAVDANHLNELFGVGTKDNTGVNPRFHELDETGEDRSRTTFKSFRLDRVNSLEATPEKLPVDYGRVKYNRSPNAGQAEEDQVRSAHGQSITSPHGDGMDPSATPRIPAQPANRPGTGISGQRGTDSNGQGSQHLPQRDDGAVQGRQGQAGADGTAQGPTGRIPGAKNARLVGRPLTGGDRIGNGQVNSQNRRPAGTWNGGVPAPQLDPANLHGQKPAQAPQAKLYSPSGFYSQLEKAVEEKMGKRAPAGQVLGLVRGAGVKPDEIKWSGLEDWLRSKSDQPIDKNELLDHLKTMSDIHVFPAEESGEPKWDYTIDGDSQGPFDSEREAQRHREREEERMGENLEYDYNETETVETEEHPGELNEDDPDHPFFASKDGDKYPFDFGDDESREDAERESMRYSNGRDGDGEYYSDAVDVPNWRDSDGDWYTSERQANRSQESLNESARNSAFDDIYERFGGVEEGDGNAPDKYSQYQAIKGGNNYRETIVTSDHITGGHSGHYSEDNYHSHMRRSDFNDPEGRPGTVIQELQSDLFQKGRDNGFVRTKSSTTYDERARIDELQRHVDDMREVPPDQRDDAWTDKWYKLLDERKNLTGRTIKPPTDLDEKQLARVAELAQKHEENLLLISDHGDVVTKTFLAAHPDKSMSEALEAAIPAKDKLWAEYYKTPEYQELLDLQAQQRALKARNPVPEAPMEKSWYEYLFRLALRDAVNEGKQWIAWPTGKAEAGVYSLAKIINTIDVHGAPTRTGFKHLAISFHDGNYLNLDVTKSGIVNEAATNAYQFQQKVQGKPLSEVLGKELASKIMSGEGNGELSGNDLDIGSKGMVGFYDDILPKAIDKYVKRWGATVEKGTVPVGRINTSREHEPIWKVNFNPALIDSVKKVGQPLFSPNALDAGATLKGNEVGTDQTGMERGSPGGNRPGTITPVPGQSGSSSPQQFFQDYLRASGGRPGDNNSDRLLRYAAEHGKIIAPRAVHALDDFALTGGIEHDVYLVPSDVAGPIRGADPQGSIIKVVRPGKWGIRGTDLEYFKSLHDLDVLTGGALKIEVLGIVPKGTWPAAVTRMAYLAGTHPRADELMKYLENLGFEKRPNFNQYDHAESDVELWDAHAKNFIKLPSGRMVPIDVLIRGDVRSPHAPRF